MVKVYDAPDYLGEKEEVKVEQPKQPKQQKEKTDGKK